MGDYQSTDLKKKLKSKPLKQNKYKVPKHSKFIVVVNPPFEPHRSKPGEPRFPRTSNDYYARLVYWFRAIFDGRHVVTCVFGLDKYSETVIVQLERGVDFEPYLGAHYWQEVLVDAPSFLEAERCSRIFEYDFEKFGHPAEIQRWAEYFPDTTNDKGLPNVRRPYPRAHYAMAPGGRDSFCKLLPPNRGPTPSPPPESLEEQVARPEPKEPHSSYVGKLDPYEAEENAFLLLRSDVPIKQEPSNSSTYVKHELKEPKLETEDPISELNDLFQQRQAAKRQTQSASAVKQEPNLVPPPSTSSSASTVVKSEDPIPHELKELYQQRQAAKRQMQATSALKQDPDFAVDPSSSFASTAANSDDPMFHELKELLHQRQAAKRQVQTAAAVKQESALAYSVHSIPSSVPTAVKSEDEYANVSADLARELQDRQSHRPPIPVPTRNQGTAHPLIPPTSSHPDSDPKTLKREFSESNLTGQESVTNGNPTVFPQFSRPAGGRAKRMKAEDLF